MQTIHDLIIESILIQRAQLITSMMNDYNRFKNKKECIEYMQNIVMKEHNVFEAQLNAIGINSPQYKQEQDETVRICCEVFERFMKEKTDAP